MLRQGVISPVIVPTEWCSGIVSVPKPNGRVRICVDLTQLKKAVQRETHPMGSVNESLAMLGESRVFTKLDANSGFWQIPFGRGIKIVDHLFHPFWPLFLQPPALWNQFRAGNISANHVRHLGGP